MNKILGLKTWLTLLLVIVLSWLMLRQYDELRRVTYVIPAGVGSGQARFEAPNEITLTLGWQDTLVIQNQDEVAHTFGPFVVLPQTTLTKRFTHPVEYEGACSLHQGQPMRLVVKPLAW